MSRLLHVDVGCRNSILAWGRTLERVWGADLAEGVA